MQARELETLIKRLKSSSKASRWSQLGPSNSNPSARDNTNADPSIVQGVKTDYSVKIQELQKQLALDREEAEKIQVCT